MTEQGHSDNEHGMQLQMKLAGLKQLKRGAEAENKRCKSARVGDKAQCTDPHGPSTYFKLCLSSVYCAGAPRGMCGRSFTSPMLYRKIMFASGGS